MNSIVLGNKSENLPIKQHYVPAWLLRNFVKRNDSTGRLWTFDLKNENSFQAPPGSVGFVSDLYTLEQECKSHAERYIVETEANDFFDKNGSKIFGEIVKNASLPKNKEDLEIMIAVVAWQAVRTPAAMDGIINATTKSSFAFVEQIRTNQGKFEDIKSELLKDPEYKDIQDFSFEDFVTLTSQDKLKLNIPKNYVLRGFLQNADYLNEVFLKRNWQLLCSKGDDFFILGDNPVQSICRNSNSDGSFASLDAFTVLPISPSHAIVGTADGRFGFSDVTRVSKSQVATINRASIINAKRWAFSRERKIHWQNENLVAEFSTDFFKWRKQIELQARSAGRELHYRELPQSYYDRLTLGTFKT